MPDSENRPRIAVGADHAGYHVKEAVKKYLESSGYQVDDMGTWSEESVDYPDYAKKVAERVVAGQDDFGFLACGTGIGMSIAANKIEGIRAAVAHDAMTARLARQHNNANVLALGGRVVTDAQAIEIVKDFLATDFRVGRHQRRVDKIAELDHERIAHS
ncbi:MAG: ribose 5-phosphate isomerase B [Candidatus Acidiferrales bacterium]|jgi:ribose 5-phosphate isomerase B